VSRGRIGVLIEELVERFFRSELCCSSCLMEFEVSRGRIRVLIVLADRARGVLVTNRVSSSCVVRLV
jgi:hypothetical protein